MKKSEYFINTFVIGFGFLSGLWIAVGVDPEAEIFNAFSTVINTLNPNSGFSILFFLMPIIILLGSVIGAFSLGGNLGLVAVGCGFLGGLLILISPIISIILLFVGIIIGKSAVG